MDRKQEHKNKLKEIRDDVLKQAGINYMDVKKPYGFKAEDAVDFYRSYKNSPHHPDSLLLKYFVHRYENHDKYKNLSVQDKHKLDNKFLKLHQKGDASEKNGHVTMQDLHQGLLSQPDAWLQILNHRDNLHEFLKNVHKGDIHYINKKPYINLTRGLHVNKEGRSEDHALASYSHKQHSGFGDYQHRQHVPFDNVWYSYDYGYKNAAGNYGAEKEFLISPHKIKYNESSLPNMSLTQQGVYYEDHGLKGILDKIKNKENDLETVSQQHTDHFLHNLTDQEQDDRIKQMFESYIKDPGYNSQSVLRKYLAIAPHKSIKAFDHVKDLDTLIDFFQLPHDDKFEDKLSEIIPKKDWHNHPKLKHFHTNILDADVLKNIINQKPIYTQLAIIHDLSEYGGYHQLEKLSEDGYLNHFLNEREIPIKLNDKILDNILKHSDNHSDGQMLSNIARTGDLTSKNFKKLFDKINNHTQASFILGDLVNRHHALPDSTLARVVNSDKTPSYKLSYLMHQTTNPDISLAIAEKLPQELDYDSSKDVKMNFLNYNSANNIDIAKKLIDKYGHLDDFNQSFRSKINGFTGTSSETKKIKTNLLQRLDKIKPLTTNEGQDESQKDIISNKQI